MGRHGLGRALVVGLATALVLTACTDDADRSPAPSPTPSEEASEAAGGRGDRIGVVVGPPSHVSATEIITLEAAVRDLAADPPEGVAEVRVVTAADAVFTADLVEFFVDDGFDVVCVVGSGAAPLLLDAARRHGATRMCGTDAAIEGGPANVVTAAVDPVALTTLAAAAVETAPPPVGLVVGPEVGPVELVEPLLTSLLPEPAPPSPPPSPPPPTDQPSASEPEGTTSESPTPQPQPAVPAVVSASTADGRGTVLGELLPSDPRAVVLLAPGATDLVGGFDAAGVVSVVVDDWVREPGRDQPDGVLVALLVDRAAQVRAAVAAARDPAGPQVRLLGLVDDVLGVTPGVVPGGETAAARVEVAIEMATAG